jgi:hypothetical protein
MSGEIPSRNSDSLSNHIVFEASSSCLTAIGLNERKLAAYRGLLMRNHSHFVLAFLKTLLDRNPVDVVNRPTGPLFIPDRNSYVIFENRWLRCPDEEGARS